MGVGGRPESYVFNVYSKEKPEHFEEGSIYQNFDSINIIDGTTSIDNENPNYPEGWEISVSDAGNNDVCTDPEATTRRHWQSTLTP